AASDQRNPIAPSHRSHWSNSKRFFESDLLAARKGYFSRCPKDEARATQRVIILVQGYQYVAPTSKQVTHRWWRDCKSDEARQSMTGFELKDLYNTTELFFGKEMEVYCSPSAFLTDTQRQFISLLCIKEFCRADPIFQSNRRHADAFRDAT
ncbi:MAG: hypothetical protein ACR2KT_11050, partial [Methylocella sp.]